MAIPDTNPLTERLDEYIALTREFLRDYEQENHLTDDGGEEFSNRTIGMSVVMALELFNYTIGHITRYNIDNVPVPTLIVIGAAGLTMSSGGIKQTRNHFTTSDGNTGGPLSEKTSLYQGWGEQLLNIFQKFGMKYKEAANLESSYGGVASEYLLLYSRTILKST